MIAAVLYISPAWAQICPDQTEAELRQCLRSNYTPTTVYSYEKARDTLFFRVARTAEDSLFGVYSGFGIKLDPAADPTSDADEKSINTEHAWPQSKGAGSGDPRADMHHLFPARSEVNSSRSNRPLLNIPDAEASTWYYRDTERSETPNSQIDQWGEVDKGFRFEPREARKGDVARALFYFRTIYPERAQARFFELQKDLLLRWHRSDPPTSVEKNRSRRIGDHQGSPNPFIEDTSLVRRAYFADPDTSTHRVVYDFNGNDDCPLGDNGVDYELSNVTLSAFSRSGPECENGDFVFNSKSWTQSSSRGSEYVSFNITPGDGYRVQLAESDSITFTARRSETGPADGELWVVTGGTDQSVTTWSLADDDHHTFTAALPQMSATGEPLEFRLYGWDASSGRGTLRFDHVEVPFVLIREEATTAPSPLELPTRAELLPPYPNPFNPQAVIPYRLSERTDVRITVVDLLGRQVALLLDRTQRAGRHQIRWSATDQPSGTYMVRMEAGPRSPMRMVTLIK